MEAQGFNVHNNIIYQDKKSTILLEESGKYNSIKRNREINISYLFITDHIEKGNIEVKYYHTEKIDC